MKLHATKANLVTRSLPLRADKMFGIDRSKSLKFLTGFGSPCASPQGPQFEGGRSPHSRFEKMMVVVWDFEHGQTLTVSG